MIEDETPDAGRHRLHLLTRRIVGDLNEEALAAHRA
jgi:hypothetical protein